VRKFEVGQGIIEGRQRKIVDSSPPVACVGDVVCNFLLDLIEVSFCIALKVIDILPSVNLDCMERLVYVVQGEICRVDELTGGITSRIAFGTDYLYALGEVET